MSSPYFNVKLCAKVALRPEQLNNDIYKYIKQNAIEKYQGKCYKSYGHILKIYKIDERSNGVLIPEDSFASVNYDIKFSCKLCKPLIGSIIVGEVVSANDAGILLTNGPINIWVLNIRNSINPKNFIFDERRGMLIAIIGNNKGVPVTEGIFLKVIVNGVRLEHGSKHVVVIGTLDSTVTDQEKNNSIMEKDNTEGKFVNYEDIS